MQEYLASPPISPERLAASFVMQRLGTNILPNPMQLSPQIHISNVPPQFDYDNDKFETS